MHEESYLLFLTLLLTLIYLMYLILVSNEIIVYLLHLITLHKLLKEWTGIYFIAFSLQ
jgi:hypothetical protein